MAWTKTIYVFLRRLIVSKQLFICFCVLCFCWFLQFRGQLGTNWLAECGIWAEAELRYPVCNNIYIYSAVMLLSLYHAIACACKVWYVCYGNFVCVSVDVLETWTVWKQLNVSPPRSLIIVVFWPNIVAKFWSAVNMGAKHRWQTSFLSYHMTFVQPCFRCNCCTAGALVLDWDKWQLICHILI